jgi:hypothetical protein
MSDRHLTVVPPAEDQLAAGKLIAEHPIEVARRALREAALVERESFWRERLLRFAECLPPRGRG